MTTDYVTSGYPMFVALGGKISVFDWKGKIIGFFHIER